MRGLFEHERLKPAILHMDKGNVRTLLELKKVMNLEITVQIVYHSCRRLTASHFISHFKIVLTLPIIRNKVE